MDWTTRKKERISLQPEEAGTTGNIKKLTRATVKDTRENNRNAENAAMSIQ